MDNVAASEAETIQDIVCQVNHSLAPITLQVIKNSGIDDPLIQSLLSNISSGWPNSSSTLFAFRHQLTVDNGIVFFNSRILLPQMLRSKAMEQAHCGHVGTSKMKQILRRLFFWPGMTKDIDDYVRRCNSCLRFSKCNKPAQ